MLWIWEIRRAVRKNIRDNINDTKIGNWEIMSMKQNGYLKRVIEIGNLLTSVISQTKDTNY